MNVKVFPITHCTECPKFNEEPIYYECMLSNMRYYEKEKDDWEEHLEQYCPLYYLEDIFDRAYAKGKEYSKNKENLMKAVKSSNKTIQWLTAHDFLEKI